MMAPLNYRSLLYVYVSPFNLKQHQLCNLCGKVFYITFHSQMQLILWIINSFSSVLGRTFPTIVLMREIEFVRFYRSLFLKKI